LIAFCPFSVFWFNIRSRIRPYGKWDPMIELAMAIFWAVLIFAGAAWTVI
jgi:hypothetical protein